MMNYGRPGVSECHQKHSVFLVEKEKVVRSTVCRDKISGRSSVWVYLLNHYIGHTFVPRSEINLIKPPFGDVLVCKNGTKNKIIIIIIYSKCIKFSVGVSL